jgi:hypothetical protein
MPRDIDLYNIGSTPEAIRSAVALLRAEFDAHNHDGTSSRSFQTLRVDTLVAQSLTMFAGTIKMGQTNYDTGVGIWMGISSGVVKSSFGNSAGNKLLFDGTNMTFTGTISGGSLNINNKSIIDSEGEATFIKVSTLNLKEYTNFEAATRFILVGDVVPTFTNTGMNVAPGTVANHYARCLWSVGAKIFAGKPTFTCSFTATAGFAAGTGSAFIGLGLPNITGATFTETGEVICGFHLKKAANVTTITVLQCDGTANLDFSNNVGSITIENGDNIELYMKINAASIDYYVRKNGGDLTAKVTLTDYMPAASSVEEYLSFWSTNKNSTDDFSFNVRSASYER